MRMVAVPAVRPSMPSLKPAARAVPRIRTKYQIAQRQYMRRIRGGFPGRKGVRVSDDRGYVATEDQGRGGDREQDDHGEVEAFADAAAADGLGEVVDEAEGEEAGDGGQGPERRIRMYEGPDGQRQGKDRAANEGQPATGAGTEGNLAGPGL